MNDKSTKTTGRGANNAKKRSPGRDEKGLFTSGNKFAEKWTEEKVLSIGKQLLEWMKESDGNFWLEDYLDTGMARWVLSVHHNKRDVAETKTEVSGAVQTVVDRFTLKIENN